MHSPALARPCELPRQQKAKYHRGYGSHHWLRLPQLAMLGAALRPGFVTAAPAPHFPPHRTPPQLTSVAWPAKRESHNWDVVGVRERVTDTLVFTWGKHETFVTSFLPQALAANLTLR